MMMTMSMKTMMMMMLMIMSYDVDAGYLNVGDRPNTANNKIFKYEIDKTTFKCLRHSDWVF